VLNKKTLLIFLSLFIVGCTSINQMTPSLPCKIFGEEIYSGKNPISSEQEAEKLFLEYRPIALPAHLIRRVNPPESVEKFIFVTTKNFEGKSITGWIPSPYGYIEKENNGEVVIRGLLVGNDGKIYSFRGCQ